MNSKTLKLLKKAEEHEIKGKELFIEKKFKKATGYFKSAGNVHRTLYTRESEKIKESLLRERETANNYTADLCMKPYPLQELVTLTAECADDPDPLFRKLTESAANLLYAYAEANNDPVLESFSRFIKSYPDSNAFKHLSSMKVADYKYLVRNLDHTQAAEFYFHIASLCHNSSQINDALKLYGLAGEIFKEHKLAGRRAYALGNMAHCYSRLNRFEDAIKYFEKSTILHEKVGNKRAIASNYFGLSELYSTRAGEIIEEIDEYPTPEEKLIESFRLRIRE